MRIAVCGNSPGELGQLRLWLEQFCVLYGILPELQAFSAVEAFTAVSPPGAFQVVFVGFGGSRGFLAARTLRERDKHCRIILIDDTPEYSVRGVRLHFSDFILRPLDFPCVVRSMKLAMGGVW